MSGKPEGYVEVHERIEAFYEIFESGSLQGSFEIQEVGGETFVVYRAEAHRNDHDPRPGIGYAWEPFPGKTNFTKDSELMNAETSAWGRALAALGFKVKEGIASGNEIRSRGGEAGNKPVSEGQLDFIESLAKEAGFVGTGLELLKDWARENLTGGKTGSASKAIEGLKDQGTRAETADRLGKASEDWDRTRGDAG